MRRPEVDKNILEKFSRTQSRSTIFDPASIMIYAIPSELTEDGYSVPWNRDLSKTDQEFARHLYPKELRDFHGLSDVRASDMGLPVGRCVEEPQAAALFALGPISRNEIYANGYAYYLDRRV